MSKALLKSTAVAATLFLSGVVLFVALLEINHRIAFGHFVRFGWHVDLLVKDADLGGSLGLTKLYALRVTNFAIRPLTFEAIPDPRFGGYGCGHGIVFPERLEHWDRANHKWVDIPEAVSVTYSPRPTDMPPPPGWLMKKRVWPGFSICAGGWRPLTVDVPGVKHGDVLRIVVSTSFTAPDDSPFQRHFFPPEIPLI